MEEKGDDQSLSIKKCWEIIKNKYIALGYKISQIPTYQAIRKRINGYKVKKDE